MTKEKSLFQESDTMSIGNPGEREKSKILDW